jgi:hypothetical protein
MRRLERKGSLQTMQSIPTRKRAYILHSLEPPPAPYPHPNKLEAETCQVMTLIILVVAMKEPKLTTI